MRQVQLDATGPPVVLHVVEVEAPVPGRGELRVRTEAAAITFIETQVRAGRSMRPGADPLALPAVLGNGVEGTVDAVGPGVDGSLVGTRVVTATGGMGGYAEQVVVPAGDPIPVPAGLAVGEAAALLADGRTALGLVRAAEPVPADRVVVTAAGGGVGTLLVQLVAQAQVASIVALASSEAKRSLALELGATVAVDPTDDDWTDRVAAAIGSATLVFDGVSGAAGVALAELTDAGGRIVRFGAASGEWADGAAAEARGVRSIFGLAAVTSPEDNRTLVVDALDRAAAGSLRVIIGQRFPLEQAAQAHAAIESRRTVGKTLLIP